MILTNSIRSKKRTSLLTRQKVSPRISKRLIFTSLSQQIWVKGHLNICKLHSLDRTSHSFWCWTTKTRFGFSTDRFICMGSSSLKILWHRYQSKTQKWSLLKPHMLFFLTLRKLISAKLHARLLVTHSFRMQYLTRTHHHLYSQPASKCVKSLFSKFRGVSQMNAHLYTNLTSWISLRLSMVKVA